MANPRDAFDAGNLALHPTEIGVDAAAGAARRVGMFYNQEATAEETLARSTEQLGRQTEQLGSEKQQALTAAGRAIGGGIASAGEAAVNYETHREVSHGAATFASMMQNLTQSWNDTVKGVDPNDPAVAKKFLNETVEPALEQFQSGFNTEGAQQWAQGHIAALRQHMFEKTAADQSTLAGQATVVNAQQTINKLSSTVHDDPSSVSFALGALKSSMDGIIGSSPTLSPADAGRARSEIMQKGAESIVKSAAIGYISRTGQVPSWASSGEYAQYINGAELQLFAKQAKAQQRADLNAQKQGVLLQKQIDEMNVHVAANKNFADNVDFDPQTGRSIIKPQFFQNTLDIARKYPNAPNAATVAKTYMDWGESQQRERAQPVISDPGIRQNLLDRMFDPNNPTTKIDILRAEADHKLDSHDATTLREMSTELEQTPLKGPVYQDTMAAVKEALGTGVMMDGHQRYANFAQSFIPQYLAAKRAGTAQPNALDTRDPQSMISKAMAPFQPSEMELARAHLARNLDAMMHAGGVAGDFSAPSGVPGAPAATLAVPRETTGRPEIPTQLRGIAALQYSPSRKQWRDQTSGKVFDIQGREVK